jgi:hypothetical protein
VKSFVKCLAHDSWRAKYEDLQRAFPLDSLMVHSFALAVSTNGERLTCGGFSIGKTMRF